jgi:hypothetical protein
MRKRNPGRFTLLNGVGEADGWLFCGLHWQFRRHAVPAILLGALWTEDIGAGRPYLKREQPVTALENSTCIQEMF